MFAAGSVTSGPIISVKRPIKSSAIFADESVDTGEAAAGETFEGRDAIKDVVFDSIKLS